MTPSAVIIRHRSEIPSLTVAESWPFNHGFHGHASRTPGAWDSWGWSSRLDWIEGWVSGAGGRLTH